MADTAFNTRQNDELATQNGTKRYDVIVLGAGIIGTSTALQLVKRGTRVALVDKGAPGEETSYGNTGVIGGAGILPTAFPNRMSELLSIAFKRSPRANYHLRFLPFIAPWLLALRAESAPQKLAENARLARPLFGRAVSEHEELLNEVGLDGVLRKNGWLSVYRTDASFAAMKSELEFRDNLGISAKRLDTDEARLLEPHLNAVFRHAIHWPDIASVSNPLAVTRAYAKRLTSLGGRILRGDARSLSRTTLTWKVKTDEGAVEAEQVVIALGPWTPDVIEPLGIRLPLAMMRGYHVHFPTGDNAPLTRPVLDADMGYVLTPMEQGIRLTTGAEFAGRDAKSTPVQIDRVMPYAKSLIKLDKQIEANPWLGRRPCFPDSRPVIGRAPGQDGMWLCYGHGHWGLTLGPVSGRLIAEMMTGTTPFTDPAPFRAERFI